MKKRNRILSGTLVIALLAALTGCGAQGGDSQEEGGSSSGESEPLVLSLGNVFNEGSIINEICTKLTEDLNNSGLFEVTYYNNSTLGTSLELMEQMLEGQNTAATLSGSDIGDQIECQELAVTMAPFLYSDVSDVYKLTDSDYYQGLMQDAADAGIHITNAQLMSGERYFWTNKEVTVPGDLEGLKVRVPTNSHYINCFTAFGATPTPIGVSELYTSLAQAVVDACEFPLVDGYGRQLYEVTQYISNTPYMCEFLMPCLPQSVWEGMSEEQQETWDQCCADAAEYGFEVYQERTEEYKQKLSDEGITFIDIDVEAFEECVPEYYELMAKDSGWSEDVYDTVTEIMNQ